MVRFFFYNKLKNLELIKQINQNFEIYDGYIIIKNYDSKNNFLEIDAKAVNNNKLLYGKIVNFNMKFDDIIQQINKIEECRFEHKIKYTIETIWTTKICGGIYQAYVIY